MRIRFKRSLVGQNFTHRARTIEDVSPIRATRLIAAGYAEAVDELPLPQPSVLVPELEVATDPAADALELRRFGVNYTLPAPLVREIGATPPLEIEQITAEVAPAPVLEKRIKRRPKR